jgi:hypothetical protein
LIANDDVNDGVNYIVILLGYYSFDIGFIVCSRHSVSNANVPVDKDDTFANYYRSLRLRNFRARHGAVTPSPRCHPELASNGKRLVPVVASAQNVQPQLQTFCAKIRACKFCANCLIPTYGQLAVVLLNACCLSFTQSLIHAFLTRSDSNSGPRTRPSSRRPPRTLAVRFFSYAA